MKTAYRVDTYEYERGWGRRDMSTTYFADLAKAESFVKDYNKDNTGPVPDTYYKAETPVSVELPETSEIIR